MRVRGGQELTHFRLHPGEEVRGPMVVVQFYRGDWLRAQNIWRRWMLAHNLPRPYGKPVHAQLAACSSHQFGEMIHANTANQIQFIDRYREEKLGLDYWWMDAGWYWNKTGWPNTGTWEVDTNRFPGGLQADLRSRPCWRGEDHRLVRAGARDAGHLAMGQAPGVAAGRRTCSTWATTRPGNG